MNKDFCINRPNSIGRIIEPCLLLLLLEGNSYGYGLVEKLDQFGFEKDSVDISLVYRNLRAMEGKGFVTSSWAESDQGPRKRTYAITDKGKIALDHWIVLLEERKRKMSLIIDKYQGKDSK